MSPVRGDLRVEVVSDWRAWRDLRLEALADTPIGFGELHADALVRPDADWEAAMLRPGFRVMAYGESGPVGMAGGFVRDTGVPVLFGVYVRPAARGRGVLALLVDEVVAWAAPAPLLLDVHVDNHRAQAAYSKLGFVDTGGRTVGGGIDGRDLLEMERT